MIFILDCCDCLTPEEQMDMLEHLRVRALQMIREGRPGNIIQAWDAAHSEKGTPECSKRCELWHEILERVPPWGQTRRT